MASIPREKAPALTGASSLSDATATPLAAARLFETLRKHGDDVVAPATVLWDLESYLSHPVKSKAHVVSAVAFNFRTEPVTQDLFTKGYLSRELFAIRGPDRVFVSVAKVLGCPLVTRDEKLLEYAPKPGVEAVTPDQFVSRRPSMA